MIDEPPKLLDGTYVESIKMWEAIKPPASEVIFPPSNVAVTFLPETAGNAGKNGAISVMAVGHFLSSVSDGYATGASSELPIR